MASHEEKCVWLTPAESARAMQPDPITKLKFTLMRFTAPLWQWYWNSRRQITIRSSILENRFHAQPRGLRTPEATDAVGTCAWVLSPTKWSALKKQLETLPGMSVMNSPAVSTVDGGQCTIGAFNSVLVAGKPVPIGTSIDLLPSVVNHSVRLLVAVVSTGSSTTSAGNLVLVRTNFAAACRTAIPNGGALLIRGANRADDGSSECWLTISPTVTDARGNPIKP
jgi:hypothetical protein